MLLLELDLTKEEHLYLEELSCKRGISVDQLLLNFIQDKIQLEKKMSEEVLELTDDQFIELAKLAHKRDVTLNQLINGIIRRKIRQEEVDKKE